MLEGEVRDTVMQEGGERRREGEGEEMREGGIEGRRERERS